MQYHSHKCRSFINLARFAELFDLLEQLLDLLFKDGELLGLVAVGGRREVDFLGQPVPAAPDFPVQVLHLQAEEKNSSK